MPRRLLIVLAGVASVLSPLARIGGQRLRSPAHRYEGAAARHLLRRARLRRVAGSPSARGRPLRNDRHLARTRPDHRRDAFGHAPKRHPGGEVPGGHRLGRGASRMHRIRLRLDPLSSEWSTLEEYEQTFHVRQLTGDVFPSSTYGLNAPTAPAIAGRHQRNAQHRRQNHLPLPEGSGRDRHVHLRV